MIYDHSETERYRDQTKNATKTPGIQFGRNYCDKCGKSKPREGCKVLRGTSRHNPTRFICAECK